MDGVPVGLYQMLGDGHNQAHASRRPTPRSVDSLEGLEFLGQVLYPHTP